MKKSEEIVRNVHVDVRPCRSGSVFHAAGENQHGTTIWSLTVGSADEVDAYLQLRGESHLVSCSACACRLVNYYARGLCNDCQRATS